MFNLTDTAIYQAVIWDRYSFFRYAGKLKRLFFVFFLFTFLLFLYGFLLAPLVFGENFAGSEIFSQNLNRKLFGFSILSFVFSIWAGILETFLNSRLKKPQLSREIKNALAQPDKYNLAEFLSFEVAKAVSKSKNNPTKLLYYLLSDNPKLNFVFSRALLNINEIKEILTKSKSDESETENFQKIILESAKMALIKGHQRIEVGEVLTTLSKYNPIFKQILIDTKLKAEDINNLTWWLESLEEKIEERKRFWDWKNLIKMGSIGKEWAAGYTITLDQFSFDVTQAMRYQSFREIFAHKTDVEAMERVLASPEKNDVLIIGQPGSGRRSMIEALANKCALGYSFPELNYKRVVYLDLPKVFAMTKSTEEAEEILDRIFDEVIYAGNVILVIDNLHEFVEVITERRAGIVDVSGVLASYLSSPLFPCIGICTFEGLHKNIEQNPAFLGLFEKVEVSEVSEEETLLILEERALRLENKYKIFVSYPALRDIVSLSSRYLPSIPFPEKAMDLLDEAAVSVSQRKEKVVLPKHIAEILTQKTQIPVGEIEEIERKKLLNLENLIHQRLINQEEAVKEVSAALRRARAEITIRKAPMGSFLFMGPTGVGKTETSKVLAEIYFGSEDRMIRLDMSEFQNIGDIPRLIGSPREEGLLTTKVKENPFSLILLDEFEKAHPNILNLFLQVFDEGYLTDGLGRKVDFKNTIIIATSNAAYQVILEALREKTEWSKVKDKLLDFIFEKGIFRPELINRFDAVVVFGPLSKENLLDIAELMLQKIKKNLAQKEIEFVITQPLKEKIAELGYDPTFGARNMQRVIQDKVGNVLAEAILLGKIRRGSRVGIDPEGFKLIINP